MAQAPLSLSYAPATPASGVRVETTTDGARVCVAPVSLWTDTLILVLKGFGTVFLTLPTLLTLAIAGSGEPVGVIIAAVMIAFWVFTMHRFCRDLRDFQLVTVIDANSAGLTWRRERGRRSRSCHIPRRHIRDIAIDVRPANWWGSRRSLFARVELWGPRPKDVMAEATVIWLTQDDYATGFEVVDRLRDALKISAADAAML